MMPKTTGTARDPLKHDRFDLERLPVRKVFHVDRAVDRDIPDAIMAASRHFSHVSTLQAGIWRVHHFSQSIFVARGADGIAGTAALLCLNGDGLANLRSGKFSITDPDEALLTRSGDVAAAIYVWLLCLPGTAVSAMGQMMLWLTRLNLARCDLYARPGSTAGERFMRKTGFQPTGVLLHGIPLWVYSRTLRPSLLLQD